MKKSYTMRINEEVLAQLEAEAVRQNRTVANLVDTILKKYFAENLVVTIEQPIFVEQKQTNEKNHPHHS